MFVIHLNKKNLKTLLLQILVIKMICPRKLGGIHFLWAIAVWVKVDGVNKSDMIVLLKVKYFLPCYVTRKHNSLLFEPILMLPTLI